MAVIATGFPRDFWSIVQVGKMGFDFAEQYFFLLKVKYTI